MYIKFFWLSKFLCLHVTDVIYRYRIFFSVQLCNSRQMFECCSISMLTYSTDNSPGNVNIFLCMCNPTVLEIFCAKRPHPVCRNFFKVVLWVCYYIIVWVILWIFDPSHQLPSCFQWSNTCFIVQWISCRGVLFATFYVHLLESGCSLLVRARSLQKKILQLVQKAVGG